MIDSHRLIEAIMTAFDLEEFKTLCSQVGIPYDDLPGDGLTVKVREGVGWASRRGVSDALIVACFNERPNLYWDKAVMDVPSETLHSMIPRMNGRSTNRLMGMQMARLEARQNRFDGELSKVKALTAANLTAGGFQLLMFVLDRMG